MTKKATKKVAAKVAAKPAKKVTKKPVALKGKGKTTVAFGPKAQAAAKACLKKNAAAKKAAKK